MRLIPVISAVVHHFIDYYGELNSFGNHKAKLTINGSAITIVFIINLVTGVITIV